uniref:Receptor ligand binding region domain-containing protein n=1 Tax=Ciona savignyi TaxID=51511 RepID=H2YIC1_CIOSA
MPDVIVASGYSSSILRGAYLTALGSVRNLLGADIFTISLLPTTSANYVENSNYLRQLACGVGVNCNRFLGSIYNPSAAANTFNAYFP